MAVHGGTSEEQCPWPDLPADLLSNIYIRSVSAYGRARFAAVCSPWRAAAAWHPRLPALPLLLLSTGDGERDREARAYSPEDGRALRVPLPWFPWGNRLVGSYQGGWIATVSRSGGLLVVNVFSGARAARLNIDKMVIRKIAFSKDPSCSGCVMAAMSSRCTVAVRRVVGSPDTDSSGWTTWSGYGDLMDIAFCDGELYGVTSGNLIMDVDLIKFDIIGVNKGGASPVAIKPLCIHVAMSSLYMVMVELSSTVKYIFELHGKLAIAVEVGGERGHFYKVFELADNGDTTTSHKYAWAEVTSLGEHALFLGPANCKAEHISTGRRGGVEGNIIYYSRQHTSFLHDDDDDDMERLDIGGCTMHYWENGSSKHHLDRIVSRGYHYCNDQDGSDDGCNGCVWLWPHDF